jgi:predicted TIM-barrel fold metal-dependent hydrolase
MSNINRRKFFRDSAFSAAGIMLAGNFAPSEMKSSGSGAAFDIMKEALKYRKINAHEHVGLGGTIDSQLDFADRFGIEKLEISRPISAGGKSLATPDEVRDCNNTVLDAMKKHPDRYLGSFFVNPIYGKEALEEINRCVGEGMIGLKVYNQVKINDPLFYPIIEKMIDLKMTILMHAHCGIGVGGKRTKYGNVQPMASVPEDFVEAATRYPEATFQYAHTGGGGDWEYACKMFRDYPNIYVDTSGSNNEGNMIDFVLKYLGEDRMFYGSDGSYIQSIGTILSSKLTDAQKKKVFFDNYNNQLKKIGRQC